MSIFFARWPAACALVSFYPRYSFVAPRMDALPSQSDVPITEVVAGAASAQSPVSDGRTHAPAASAPHELASSEHHHHHGAACNGHSHGGDPHHHAAPHLHGIADAAAAAAVPPAAAGSVAAVAESNAEGAPSTLVAFASDGNESARTASPEPVEDPAHRIVLPRDVFAPYDAASVTVRCSVGYLIARVC